MMDVMIDIETIGTHATAPVLSIGAVAFDRNKGPIQHRFYVEIDVSSAIKGRDVSSAIKGRDVSGDALKWWMKQSDESRNQAFGVSESTEEALERFTLYLQGVKSTYGSYKVWGNGSSFDIAILENLYQQYDMGVPWNFWDVRDCRTVEDISKLERSSVKRKGTHHNALDNAIYQAQYITMMLQELK